MYGIQMEEGSSVSSLFGYKWTQEESDPRSGSDPLSQVGLVGWLQEVETIG